MGKEVVVKEEVVRTDTPRNIETGVRGVSRRTNAQTQRYFIDLTVDELVCTVTAIKRGVLTPT